MPSYYYERIILMLLSLLSLGLFLKSINLSGDIISVWGAQQYIPLSIAGICLVLLALLED